MRRVMYAMLVCCIFLSGCSMAKFGLTDATSDSATDMAFVPIKGGCFAMGSNLQGGGTNDNSPVHDVCVGDFLLGKYEVTQAQWVSVMGNNPSHFKECGPKCPVDSVSWDEAQDFIKKLSAKSNRKYRLPTEAEWEYAARSGGKNDLWAGTNEESKLEDYAWYVKNSNVTTHKVGKLDPNGLGLYDMSGNVWEWCEDFYSETYYKDSPKDNPLGASSGDSRVIRGGSYGNPEKSVRVYNRNYISPDTKNDNSGLRLLMIK